MAMIDDGQIFSCDVSPQGKKRRIYTQRDPVKAISAITPFNHPLNQVAHKVAPSIATNNRMVLKPSEKTPLTALLLADMLYEAGLPPQMFSVVTGDALVTRHRTSSIAGPQLLPSIFHHDRDAARAFLGMLRTSRARVVLPGHGEAWVGTVDAAVDLALESGAAW